LGSILLDLAILVVFVAAAVDGFRRGFVPYLSELGAFAAGLVLAFGLFEPLGQVVHRGLAVGVTLAGFGAFLALLAVGHGVAHVPVRRGATWIADRLRPRLTAGQFRAVGVMPAFVAALALAAVLLGILAAIPVGATRSLVSHSTVGSVIATRTAFLQGPLRQLLVAPATPAQKILANDPSTNPGEDAFYRLHFPANLQTQLDQSAEVAMLQRINASRASAGLSRLRMDPALQEAARAHSLDMYQRHYFSHQTPDGKTPFDRLQAVNAHYLTAGENIAFAPDPNLAWDSLMQSPDHRANILNPDFQCVGIGAYKGLGGYEEMFTQDFADCSS
jgi:uncharacterized protein YkwD